MNKLFRIYDKSPKVPRRASCLWLRPVRLHIFHVLGFHNPHSSELQSLPLMCIID